MRHKTRFTCCKNVAATLGATGFIAATLAGGGAGAAIASVSLSFPDVSTPQPPTTGPMVAAATPVSVDVPTTKPPPIGPVTVVVGGPGAE